jgi:hypothetical protein
MLTKLKAATGHRMPMPLSRGPVSSQLIAGLRETVLDWDELSFAADCAMSSQQVCSSEDLQVALLIMYELHYRGIDGVSDGWEWNPGLLGVRASIETRFERELRGLAGSVQIPAAGDLPEKLFAMTAPTPGPSLSRYIATKATDEQFGEFLTHRSVYHLKEADPHCWAIPRLAGAPKAALVEVEADEYGGGRAERMHATLFADTMRALWVWTPATAPWWTGFPRWCWRCPTPCYCSGCTVGCSARSSGIWRRSR